MVAYQAYVLWGTTGILVPLGVIAVGLWWTTKSVERREAERWAKATAALSLLKSQRDGPGETRVSGSWLKTRCFCPSSAAIRPPCAPTIWKFTQVVLKAAAQLTGPIDLSTWSRFQTFLKENGGRRKPLQTLS